jgi:hypothetical protein
MVVVFGKVKTDTWDGFQRFCRAEGYTPTFEPADQDLFAAWCIQRRGAMPDVLRGDLEVALAKCAREWASLPGSPYGQPTLSLEKARRVWDHYTADAPITAEPEPEIPAPEVQETEQEKPMPAAFLWGLASSLIEAFTPLAKEKINKEISRHTSNPEVADRVANSVIETVKEATKKADPIEAVATAKGDPEIIAKAEESALETLEKLQPLLDKVAKWDSETAAAHEASMDAAAKRAAGDAYEMAPLLVWAAFILIGVLVLGLMAAVLVQVVQGKVNTEVWAALTGVIGWATGIGGLIYNYRFGTSRSSAAKDVVIGELNRRRK